MTDAGENRPPGSPPHTVPQRVGPTGQPFPQPGPAGREACPNHTVRRPNGPTIRLRLPQGSSNGRPVGPDGTWVERHHVWGICTCPLLCLNNPPRRHPPVREPAVTPPRRRGRHGKTADGTVLQVRRRSRIARRTAQRQLAGGNAQSRLDSSHRARRPSRPFPVGELFHSPGLPRQRLPGVPGHQTPEACRASLDRRTPHAPRLPHPAITPRTNFQICPTTPRPRRASRGTAQRQLAGGDVPRADGSRVTPRPTRLDPVEQPPEAPPPPPVREPVVPPPRRRGPHGKTADGAVLQV